MRWESPAPVPVRQEQKLHESVLGICLSRSLVLQDIAQTRRGRVKTSENLLSGFLGQKRLDLRETQKASTINNAAYLTPVNADLDPMSLATTLTTASTEDVIADLLAAAYMAFLVLALLAELCRRGHKRALRPLLRQMKDILCSRFARPPKMTLGRFFQLMAMDLPNPRQVGVPL